MRRGYSCGVSETVRSKRPRFLAIEQVAEELNVGVPTVRMLLKSGELRGIQIGGKGLWRVGRVDIEDYIQTANSKAAEAQDNSEPDGDDLGPE